MSSEQLPPWAPRPRQGGNPCGPDASPREQRTPRRRVRAKKQLPPTQCGATCFKGEEVCGREKAADEPVCFVCAKVIVYGQSGETWFQLWMMEFVGEHARRSALADARARQAQARRAQREESGGVEFVYYVRTKPGRLKIGTSSNLVPRLADFRSDLGDLLALEPGGYDREQERHRELRKWRVVANREDYAEGPEVLARIAAVRAERGDPIELFHRLSDCSEVA